MHDQDLYEILGLQAVPGVWGLVLEFGVSMEKFKAAERLRLTSRRSPLSLPLRSLRAAVFRKMRTRQTSKRSGFAHGGIAQVKQLAKLDVAGLPEVVHQVSS